MIEKSLKNNYFIALLKVIIFVLILCFLVELSKAFLGEARIKDDFKGDIVYLSIFLTFVCYIFIVDFNGFYKKVQNFFFHSGFLSLLVPAVLIVLGIIFFIIPKVFNLSFDKHVFIFIGGFILTSHLIFIARETKGNTFFDIVNYLFSFSLLYILNLIIFGLYLKVISNFDIAKVIVDGTKSGAFLIADLFTQIFR